VGVQRVGPLRPRLLRPGAVLAEHHDDRSITGALTACDRRPVRG
jgi:hypothetical protein